ncbi:MAG: protease, partial [Planctomycetes bacterium]|nr:protease [Planctomycetota bacterium]
MKYVLALCVAAFVSLTPALAGTEGRLLRFPAIHEDQIVFTYAGDLYTVSAQGGTARKLTNNEGFEMFARFSPDGKTLAFTGQYDGNTEVYVMPASGGVPHRLTYTATLGRDDVADRMGPNNIVMTWSPDGRRIIFRSRMRSYNAFLGRLYSVSTSGEVPEELPLPRGGFCSFSPDGKKLAYNRVFREFRTWKRYRGGMADDIWVYDFDTKTTENITNHPALDIIPMWHGDRIFFLSDRDGHTRMNLFVYDTKSKETRKLTNFSEFDVKFPSLGPNAIVFENGGYVYRYDIARGECAKVDISIEDDLQGGRGGLVSVADKVTNYEISPDGKRALFGARGDVFTVPAKHGAIRNLTSSPGVHDRSSKWSPDGRWIAYISDASGEDEIWVIPQDGRGPARQVTKDDAIYKYHIEWSPDSKKILWADKALRLRYVNVETGKITDVCKCEKWEFSEYAWAPDSQWIVYAQPEVASMSKIYLYSLQAGTSHELTDGWYDSARPIFSSDGRFVLFVSDRDFNPIYSRTEWNHAYQDMSRIYLITLAKATESPFKPKSDEVEVKAAEEKKAEDEAKKPDVKEEKKKAEPETIKVDLDGIKDRIAVL